MAGAIPVQHLFAPGQWFWPDDNKDIYIRDGYKELPNLYGIISLIIQKSSMVPFEIYRVGNKQKYSKYKAKMKMARTPKDFADCAMLKKAALEKVEGTEMEELLHKPNDKQSLEELWEQLDGYKLLTGNSYLWGWTPGVGNNANKPTELHVPPSTMVSIVTGTMNDPVKEYKLSYLTEGIEAAEIAHFKTWNPLTSGDNPFNEVYGMSPLISCRRLMAKYKVADVSQGSMFKNMAPAGILSGDTGGNGGLEETQAVALKDRYKQLYSGADKAGEIIITSANLKWNQIGFSPVDLNVIEAKKEILGELCNVYHVPIALFSETNSTDNNLTESRKMMITDAVIPLVESRKQTLNRWLCPKFGEDLVIEFDYSVFSEISEELDRIAKTQALMWWSTGNEKRLATNMDEMEDPLMNKVFIPSNLIPIDQMDMPVNEPIIDPLMLDEGEDPATPPTPPNNEEEEIPA